MSNSLSPELLAQLFSQESTDPFLTLVTLSHDSFPSPLYFVNNVDDVVSRGITFKAFPFSLILPTDDGESDRQVRISFDNVSLEILDELRTVTTQIEVTLELVLASNPSTVQISLGELKMAQVNYDAKKVSCVLIADNFLVASLTSEKYTPINYLGLF